MRTKRLGAKAGREALVAMASRLQDPAATKLAINHSKERLTLDYATIAFRDSWHL